MIEPEPVEKLRPEVPAEVAAMVRKLMSKKPEARFQTPAEFETAVTPYARNVPLDWPEPAGSDLEDELPADDTDPRNRDSLASDDSVLVGTVPPSFAPTVLSSNAFSRTRRPRRRWLFWAAIIIAVLGGLGVVAALVIRQLLSS
jgi:hypothetical protein